MHLCMYTHQLHTHVWITHTRLRTSTVNAHNTHTTSQRDSQRRAPWFSMPGPHSARRAAGAGRAGAQGDPPGRGDDSVPYHFPLRCTAGEGPQPYTGGCLDLVLTLGDAPGFPLEPLTWAGGQPRRKRRIWIESPQPLLKAIVQLSRVPHPAPPLLSGHPPQLDQGLQGLRSRREQHRGAPP